MMRAVPPTRAARGAARPRRRIRLDNDQRRAQILELAKRAFSDRAYDDVSIDDLARVAGISKGLLYHYFPTKRDLYVAGLREIADELVEAITRLPDELAAIGEARSRGVGNPTAGPAGRGASPVGSLDQIRAGVDAYLDYVMRHSRAFVALMRGGIGSDPEVAAVVEGVRTRLFDRFLVGSPFANLLAGDARFETAVRGWLGFVEAASIDWCANPRLLRGDLCELLTQVLFEVLRVAVPAVLAPA